MLVIERLERFCVPELGALDCLSFAKFGVWLLSWLGQVAFSGRTDWDAA
jgi:hypothetical protein